MGNKRLQMGETDSSVKFDNFRLIKGVNNAVESRLHKAGILTFAQFASMSPEDIVTLILRLPGVTVERIIKQNWIEQARELALQPKVEESSEDEAPASSVERYATFITEMLLGVDDELIEARVKHLQTKEESIFQEWDEGRFIRFFTERADLKVEKEPSSGQAKELESTAAASEIPAQDGAIADEAAESEALAEALEPPNKQRVNRLEILPDGSDLHSMLLRRNQPYRVRLSIDFSDIAARREEPLAFTAVVSALSLDNRANRTFSRTAGKIKLAETTVINLGGVNLKPGSYRLGADITIHRPGQRSPLSPEFHIQAEAPLLRVY